MSANERSEPGVWQQLRRRRVTRTVVTYLAAAFAVMEITWYVVPRYGLVEDVSRLVAGLLVLGFPLTVVLAYTYDVTPQGIVRTPDEMVTDAPDPSRPRLHRATWLLLCVLVAAVGLVFRALRM
jgi:hypothetical protein